MNDPYTLNLILSIGMVLLAPLAFLGGFTLADMIGRFGKADDERPAYVTATEAIEAEVARIVTESKAQVGPLD